MSIPNISFVWNTEVVDIKDIDQGKVTSLVLRDTQNGKTSELAVDGVFIGIGHVPNTALFKGQLAMHDNVSQDARRIAHQRAGLRRRRRRITCIARQ
jgi:thioredoxin reductase